MSGLLHFAVVKKENLKWICYQKSRSVVMYLFFKGYGITQNNSTSSQHENVILMKLTSAVTLLLQMNIKTFVVTNELSSKDLLLSQYLII